MNRKPGRIQIILFALVVQLLSSCLIAPQSTAADGARLYDMIRVEKVNPRTGFFSGKPTSGGLNTPPVLAAHQSCLVSESGVVHFFNSIGTELINKRIRLDGATFSPAASVTTGDYADSAFIVDNSGSCHVVRNGVRLLYIPSGNPPNGLPVSCYSGAIQIAEHVMALGDNNNNLVFVNLRERSVAVYPLRPAKTGYISTPIIVNHKLFATSSNGLIYQVEFDAQKMKLESIKSHNARQAIDAPPISLPNGDIAYGLRFGRILFLRPDFSLGRISEKNIGSIIGDSGLALGEDVFIVHGTNDYGSHIGAVNTSTLATSKITLPGAVHGKPLFFHYRGKRFILFVDGDGGGYITNERLNLVGTFDLLERPYSSPFVLDGKVRISTASARLATLEFKNFANARIEPVDPGPGD